LIQHRYITYKRTKWDNRKAQAVHITLRHVLFKFITVSERFS